VAFAAIGSFWKNIGQKKVENVKWNPCSVRVKGTIKKKGNALFFRRS
jgi:hypothetical protein